MARRIFSCTLSETVASSSRISVPPSARSKWPTCVRAAPVNAPASWPNSSDSRIDSVSAARQRIHDRKIDDAMVRFESLTRRIDDVEGQVEAYDMGLPQDLNREFASLEAEESVNEELDELKRRLAAGRRSFDGR